MVAIEALPVHHVIGMNIAQSTAPYSAAVASRRAKNADFSLAFSASKIHSKSLPIQDEPGGGVGFQYKMSLGRMAC